MNRFIQTSSFILPLLLALTLSSSLVLPDENSSISGKQTDLLTLSGQIDNLIQKYHYNPRELESEAYKEQTNKIMEIAISSDSPDAFISAFNQAWQNGPFSHVRLAKAQQSADELAKFLDRMNVGGTGIQLKLDGDTAILTVNTMMGQDTIEQIFDAYQLIQEQEVSFLVIDLRNNDGGAFAIRPLIGHLISQPTEGGYFISQKWSSTHIRKPSKAEVNNVSPWEGWSIERFWQDVQTSDILRIQHHPMTPHFSGHIYVLVSGQTFSAAEIAVSALKDLPNVTVIGEKTAGQVLSQKVFDVTPGYHLFLPVADYYSAQGTRIEGEGISPEIEASAEQAMSVAQQHIENAKGK
ncbi:MAG: S41 family peptidase, partial [Pseudomonadales bacterium]